MSTTNQIATAICKALGMPSRFAAEKPPVSLTLRGALKTYAEELSDKSLERVSIHGSKMCREAAQVEIARRAAPNPETHCPTCGEPLSEYGHCWQHHWPPMDPAQDTPQPQATATK